MLDSKKPIDVESIRGQGGAAVADVSIVPQERGQAVRFRLNRPQLPSLSGEDLATGTNWTVTFADTVQTPSQALSAIRNIADPSLANVTVPMPGAGMLHRFTDPDAGDTLFVVTARAPARGFIKRQDFVELSLLESIHGVAIRPNSDEVTADVGPDKVVLGKPGGLTLSPADSGAERAPTAVRPIFDLGEWRKNLEGNFNERADALIEAAGAAASAGPEQRMSAQVDLARFYMARAMFPEAVGVLNLALSDSKPGSEEPSVLIVHALANILMGRAERGLKDLASPAIGTNYDSQLWKAIASARQGKWADAREKFKSAEFAITSLPIDLQRIVIADAMHASIEVKDYPGAAKRASELDVIGIAPEQAAAVGVLRGRLAEGLGHDKDALDEYKRAAASSDRAAATEARLLLVGLKQRRDEISQEDALRELETLAITWRGDTLEVQALEMLARIYADSGRFAESFGAVRTANLLAPNLEISRQGQDAASALFAQLFLGPKGDDLPPIDALGMFYEYRDLTPIAWWPSTCSTRPPSSCNTRSTSGSKAPRGRRSLLAWQWSISPTTSRSARSLRFARPGSPISRENCASSASCSMRARRATSDVMTSRSTSFPMSRVGNRSGCVPISTGRRVSGASRTNRSNSITPTAGATSNRSALPRRATSSARWSVMRWRRIPSG